MSKNLREQFIARHPKTKGIPYIVPAPNQLQLDIDGKDELIEARRLIKMYSALAIDNKKLPQILTVKTEPSSTPGHFHTTITVNVILRELERILLQTVLGSHRYRELLSYAGSKMNVPDPILFYTKGNKPTIGPGGNAVSESQPYIPRN